MATLNTAGWTFEFPTGITREAMLAELQAADPNGCWTDSAAEADGMEALSMEETLFHFGRYIQACNTGDAI